MLRYVLDKGSFPIFRFIFVRNFCDVFEKKNVCSWRGLGREPAAGPRDEVRDGAAERRQQPVGPGRVRRGRNGGLRALVRGEESVAEDPPEERPLPLRAVAPGVVAAVPDVGIHL